MENQGEKPSARLVRKPVPSAEPKNVPIMSPKPASPVRLILLGGPLFGVETHWLENRTIPHQEPIDQCPGCRAGVSKRWKGYLCGWLPGPCRKVIVELTAEGCRSCPHLGNDAIDLRGRGLTLSRVGKARNAPVKCELGPALRGPVEPHLPGQFDLEVCLCRIWGIDPSTGDITTPSRAIGGRKNG